MRRDGFTLLEVIVALTLIGIGFSVLFAGMSGSLRGLERVELTEHRVEQARLKLAQVDLIRVIRPRDSASGVFEDGVRWTVEASPFIPAIEDAAQRNPASVIRVALTLEWNGRNGPQKRVLETYRYQPVDGTQAPSLEQQLHQLE